MAEKQRNLYQRLIAAMDDVRYVQKERGKDGELKFSIVTHDAVTALCRTALMKNGVYAYPEITQRDFSTFKVTRWRNGQEETTEYAAMTVQINMNFVNADAPDERITVQSIGIGVDKLAQQDKCPGKAISYAVKYGYLKGLALETGDDPDTEQTRGEDASRNSQDAPQATTATFDGQPAPSVSAEPPSPAKAALQPVDPNAAHMNALCEGVVAKYPVFDIKHVRKYAKQYTKAKFPTVAVKDMDVHQLAELTDYLWKCFDSDAQEAARQGD